MALDLGMPILVVDDYQTMYNHFPTGPAVTYGITLIGEPTIPGAQTFGEVFPVTFDVETPGPHNIPFTGIDNPLQGTVTVTTPLPEGNVADQSSRWALIEQDTWPAFADLTDEEIRERMEEKREEQRREARGAGDAEAGDLVLHPRPRRVRPRRAEHTELPQPTQDRPDVGPPGVQVDRVLRINELSVVTAEVVRDNVLPTIVRHEESGKRKHKRSA